MVGIYACVYGKKFKQQIISLWCTLKVDFHSHLINHPASISRNFCIILDITHSTCVWCECVFDLNSKVQSTLQSRSDELSQERPELSIFSSFLSLISEVLPWNSLNSLLGTTQTINFSCSNNFTSLLCAFTFSSLERASKLENTMEIDFQKQQNSSFDMKSSRSSSTVSLSKAQAIDIVEENFYLLLMRSIILLESWKIPFISLSSESSQRTSVTQGKRNLMQT